MLLNILVDPVFSDSASPMPFTVKAFPGSNAYTAADMSPIDVLADEVLLTATPARHFSGRGLKRGGSERAGGHHAYDRGTGDRGGELSTSAVVAFID
nr:hypothetical protein [uncultured Chitinophaga sp.]